MVRRLLRYNYLRWSSGLLQLATNTAEVFAKLTNGVITFFARAPWFSSFPLLLVRLANVLVPSGAAESSRESAIENKKVGEGASWRKFSSCLKIIDTLLGIQSQKLNYNYYLVACE